MNIDQIAQNIQTMDLNPRTREGLNDYLKCALSELDFKNYD